MRRPEVTRSPHRASRVGMLVLAAVCLLAPLFGDHAPAAAATRSGIQVVQVEGLLDPPNAALVERSVHNAEAAHAMLLVFQLDSSGVVDTDIDHLSEVIGRANVPVAMWIGPSGANARGGAALLALSAPIVAIAQGGGIGPVAPAHLDHPHEVSLPALRRRVTDLQATHGRSDALVDRVITHRVSAVTAANGGLVNRASPTLGLFLASLNGAVVETAAGPVHLSTTRVVVRNGRRTNVTSQVISFAKLTLREQLAHTLGTPWVAYALFVIGGALIVFEFFTISIGIAGVVGAAAIVGACFGFSHLPAQGWAIALLVLAMIGFAIDVQATALGAWTFIGAAALVAGSVFLYGGSSRLDPAWWVIVIVCVGTVVFMLSGMTAMVRSRFSTPTVGREDLVGELGAAEVDVDPDGVVRIRDALWRARTNRATPIAAGDTVRVVAVEGIVLEVEPEEGGARDHRERRTSPSA